MVKMFILIDCIVSSIYIVVFSEVLRQTFYNDMFILVYNMVMWIKLNKGRSSYPSSQR